MFTRIKSQFIEKLIIFHKSHSQLAILGISMEILNVKIKLLEILIRLTFYTVQVDNLEYSLILSHSLF
jgi:hypothetical protein